MFTPPRSKPQNVSNNNIHAPKRPDSPYPSRSGNPNKSRRIFLTMFNPHQRCGYSDSPFARIYFFHTAGSRNGLEGMVVVCPPKLTLRKRHFFLIEKYIEDARQDEKHVPDLLESITQPPGLVKEELRPISSKMDQFGSKILQIKVSTFWIPEIQSFPARGQCQPSRQ